MKNLANVIAIILLSYPIHSSSAHAAPRGRFVRPLNLGASVNTPLFDLSPVISPDGLSLYLASATTFGDQGSVDIFRADRESVDNAFEIDRVRVENGLSDSLWWEEPGSMSQDGLTLYFHSVRPNADDGAHGTEMFVATRETLDDEFGNVLPLEELNTPANEWAGAISADELTYYFSRETPDNGFDFFVASRASKNEPFEAAVPLEGVNTPWHETSPTISTDGLTLIFSDSIFLFLDPWRPEALSFLPDIWVSTRNSTDESFGEAVNLSTLWPESVINTDGAEMSPYLSPDWPAAGSKLYYVTDTSQRGDIWEVTWIPEDPGDFNGDGQVDIIDLEILSDAIVKSDDASHFDINGDQLVDQSDRSDWVQTARGTWFGDANLDGVFDSSDLVQVFLAGEYRDTVSLNSTWNEGDWNGDREFDSDDLVLAFNDGGYDQGARSSVGAAPEPASNFLLVAGCLVVLIGLRRN